MNRTLRIFLFFLFTVALALFLYNSTPCVTKAADSMIEQVMSIVRTDSSKIVDDAISVYPTSNVLKDKLEPVTTTNIDDIEESLGEVPDGIEADVQATSEGVLSTQKDDTDRIVGDYEDDIRRGKDAVHEQAYTYIDSAYDVIADEYSCSVESIKAAIGNVIDTRLSGLIQGATKSMPDKFLTDEGIDWLGYDIGTSFLTNHVYEAYQEYHAASLIESPVTHVPGITGASTGAHTYTLSM